MRLTPELLLSAYAQGVFPMDDDGTIYWYDPDPRAVIPLDERFHVPKSLARTIRKGRFEIRVDTAFRATMQACAAAAPGRTTTWISDELIDVYTQLHVLGFAHSVETWLDGEMVGGLYGVALRGLFAGESMWSRATDASKAALVALVERLRARGFLLLDTQFTTPHLERFGAHEIPRRAYQLLLRKALAVDPGF
ncbi:MAG TPA: leucyl/phenylalanyl-tRNA--protein transferase [Herpetosiphonaceae bacterium]